MPPACHPPGKRLRATATEVTQAQFARLFPAHVAHFSPQGFGRGELNGVADTGDWPVDVSADEAAAFCAKLGRGCRLMTLAEFDALAAAHPTPVAGWLVSPSPFRTLGGGPRPVGAADAGFRHIYGNVAEWVADGDRVLAAGGSYLNTAADCQHPVPYSLIDRRCHVGFRVVREQ